MKKLIFLPLLVFVWQSTAQKPNYDEVANRIVTQSLQVKKGEHVLIGGEPAVQEIMEALYVAVYKAGGLPVVNMYFPEADARTSREVKPEYLAQTNYAGAVLSRMVDCEVWIETNTDPARWNDLSPEALKAYRESRKGRESITKHDRTRVVTLGQTDGIPSEAVAKVMGADYQQLKQNFWKAVAVDHDALKLRADQVIAQLQPGSTVKVKSPYGTNISFKLHTSKAMASCGNTMDQQRSRGNNYAWLPAGDVFMALDPNSANGTIVMPAYYMGNTKLTNLKVEFANGKIKQLSADQDVSKLKMRLLSGGAENAQLGSMDLGINPHSKVLGDYRSFEMAGMVSLGTGGNSWAGGDYTGTVSYFFHLKDATLEIGSKKVVDKGALTSK